MIWYLRRGLCPGCLRSLYLCRCLGSSMCLFGHAKRPSGLDALAHCTFYLFDLSLLVFRAVHETGPWTVSMTGDPSEGTRAANRLDIVTFLLPNPTSPTACVGSHSSHIFDPDSSAIVKESFNWTP